MLFDDVHRSRCAVILKLFLKYTLMRVFKVGAVVPAEEMVEAVEGGVSSPPALMA